MCLCLNLYNCMCVCMCVWEREREKEFMCEKTLCVSEIVFAYGCLCMYGYGMYEYANNFYISTYMCTFYVCIYKQTYLKWYQLNGLYHFSRSSCWFCQPVFVLSCSFHLHSFGLQHFLSVLVCIWVCFISWYVKPN